jgi:hypothetical protein
MASIAVCIYDAVLFQQLLIALHQASGHLLQASLSFGQSPSPYTKGRNTTWTTGSIAQLEHLPLLWPTPKVLIRTFRLSHVLAFRAQWLAHQ